ncbi:hypothetical protein GHT07_18890 [Caenimonas koreensis DSM 17982]|uniref:Uncharacterized protein n=1 Tax=Caenimonas koreensis DSM 17982 TaxID=1121255 RepID=A0A844BD14_9BURK|nr:hypothetical protein [Caenimonas koreensis]MRD49347.1 hypothetical protein [Caenimonas koreensis DSM 17982]
MSSFKPVRWLALIFISATAIAQQPPQPVASSPQPPAAATYRSAFDGYRPFTDEKVLTWPESNGTVGRIGGWRAYAAEVQGKPAPAAAGPATPAASGSQRPASQVGSGHQH